MRRGGLAEGGSGGGGSGAGGSGGSWSGGAVARGRSPEGGQGLQKRRATPEFVFAGAAAVRVEAAWVGAVRVGWWALEWHNSGHSKCTSQFSQNCLDQTMSGQTLSGQTSFGQTWFWPQLVWPNLVLSKVGLAKSWPSGLGEQGFRGLGFFLVLFGFLGFLGFFGFQGFTVFRFQGFKVLGFFKFSGFRILGVQGFGCWVLFWVRPDKTTRNGTWVRFVHVPYFNNALKTG